MHLAPPGLNRCCSKGLNVLCQGLLGCTHSEVKVDDASWGRLKLGALLRQGFVPSMGWLLLSTVEDLQQNGVCASKHHMQRCTANSD